MPAFSAIFGAQAAGDAADAQTAAAQYAAELQWKMYKQSRADLMPFLQAGYKQIPYQTKALANYVDLIRRGPGSFEKSPYYRTLQASMGEASQALDRSAVARGRGPGTYGKALTDYGMGKAGELRSNWINEWLATKLNPTGQVAQVGTNPYAQYAGQASNLASMMGQSLADLNMQAGQAQASGYLGRYQALQGGLSGGMNLLGMGLGAMKLGGVGGMKWPGATQYAYNYGPSYMG